MKKYVAIISALFLICTLAVAVSAVSEFPRLVDSADVMNEYDEAEVLDYLDKISEELKFDVVAVTVDSLGGSTAQSYADDFYDYNGYGYGSDCDGIILLVAMAEREYAISTTGFGITVFSDSDLDCIEEQFILHLSNGDYKKAFMTYASLAAQLVEYAENYGKDYDENGYDSYEPYPFESYYNYQQSNRMSVGGKFGVSCAIGAVASLIIMFGMKSGMKKIRPNNSANVYIRAGSLNITRSNDIYLYRNVHKTRRQTETGNSSSHHGGGSIHVGSSGRSHGGSSGRF